MAYPTFVAAGAAISVPGSGVAAAVAVPAGVASGDLLLCVMLLGNGSTNTPTGPSGFTQIDNKAPTAFEAGMYLYYKIASGSEPSTYNVSQSGANQGSARMYAWTGVDGTTPINVNTKSSKLTSVTTINLPSATTTVAECLHIGISLEYNGRTPTISATGSQTALGGSTLSGRVFQVTEEQIATASAVTGRTHSSGTSGDFFAFSLGIAPVGGGAGITGTASQTLDPFTQSATGTVVSGIAGSASQTLAPFTQSAEGTVTGAGAITGTAAQTLAAFTHSAAGTVTTPSVVLGPFKNNTGGLLASQAIAHALVVRASDRNVTLSLAGLTTDGSGLLTIASTSLVLGTAYMVPAWNADGSSAGIKRAVAS